MGAPVGNVNALKNKPFADALARAIAQDDGVRLRAIAEKLLNMAADGDLGAMKELFDRTDGKSTMILAGPDGGNIPLGLTVEYVPAKSQSPVS